MIIRTLSSIKKNSVGKVVFIAEKRVDIPRDRTNLVDLMRSKVLVNPEKKSDVGCLWYRNACGGLSFENSKFCS